ncbi:alpha/beta fold hydrolase [Pandoraea terrigena]|uniref:3-oxoadipate enol-lactone hydrolase n=1 Tax=Pandoraea terrigena TaxID=2508292 RepID=A0A5E4WL33_9BURK|nr:alpha/beta hydrolase [Pandoraea terrigena]VVE25707.1 3-oxoadipate enol-lactone hydrolase [Pandoraea terrigena]
MNWVEVNDTRLRYKRQSAPGPLLVLIHEMGGAIESWDQVCDDLGETANWLRYDMRGAGDSEKVRHVSIDDHVEDLLALLDMLGEVRPVVLAGVAVGAAIALRFASRHAKRVAKVIGLAPACGVAAAKRDGTRALAERVRVSGLHDTYPLLFSLGWPEAFAGEDPAPPTVRDRYLQRSLENDPASFAAVLDMLSDLNLDSDLAALKCDTTLIGGRHDALRPPAEIERLASLGSTIDYVIVASGHFMTVQNPRLVSRLLRRHGLLGEPLRDVVEATT